MHGASKAGHIVCAWDGCESINEGLYCLLRACHVLVARKGRMCTLGSCTPQSRRADGLPDEYAVPVLRLFPWTCQGHFGSPAPAQMVSPCVHASQVLQEAV